MDGGEGVGDRPLPAQTTTGGVGVEVSGSAGDGRRGVGRRGVIAGVIGALVLLGLLAVWWMLPVSSAGATGVQRCHEQPDGTFAITGTIDEKTGPATDGSLVVWGERVDETWGVYALPALDAQYGRLDERRLLAVCEARPTSIGVSGSKVVWQEGEAPASSVWYCLASGSGEPTKLADQASQPALATPNVVWVDHSRDADGDIVAADVHRVHEGTVDVATGEGAQRHPSVFGDLAVWETDGELGRDLYGCSLRGGDVLASPIALPRCERPALDPGTPFVVCGAEGDQTMPALWSGIVVWQDSRGGDLDIWAGPALPAGHDVQCRGAGLVGCEMPELAEPRAICQAAGDQHSPTLASPVVYWVDDRSGQSDIHAYDVATDFGALMCGELGSQVEPSAGGDAVVWLDGRTGGGRQDIYFSNDWADEEEVEDEIDDEMPAWTDDKVLTVILAAIGELGVFDDVRFSTDGGETWSDWQPVADPVQLSLDDGQGRYTIAMLFRTAEGREFGPVTVVVRRDTRAPRARTKGRVKMRRGRRAYLRFVVRDNMSPRVRLVAVIRNKRGKVVKRFRWKNARISNRRVVRVRFQCRLRRGHYRYSVRAVDLAGNRQPRAASSHIIVR